MKMSSVAHAERFGPLFVLVAMFIEDTADPLELNLYCFDWSVVLN